MILTAVDRLGTDGENLTNEALVTAFPELARHLLEQRRRATRIGVSECRVCLRRSAQMGELALTDCQPARDLSGRAAPSELRRHGRHERAREM